MRRICLYFTLLFAFPVFSHDLNESYSSFIEASSSAHYVDIEETQDFIKIKSNGIPAHDTGTFPNRGNPHSISKQKHVLRVSKNPKLTGKMTESRFFGVAKNGVMFVPGTAGCWEQKKDATPNGATRRRNRPPPRPAYNFSCEWREEALVNGVPRLGLDKNNAHVQPSGMYHYHGIPTGLVNRQVGNEDGNLIFVGYAGDGFKIFVSSGNMLKSSYRLKNGSRMTGPKGIYNGEYTEDFEYVDGLGNLDECNGLEEKNLGYIYLLTDTFPYVPRCWKGTPDKSFIERPEIGARSHNIF